MAVADVACLQDLETEADSDSVTDDDDVQIYNEYDEYILQTFGRHLLRRRNKRRQDRKQQSQQREDDDDDPFVHYEVAKVSGTVEPDLQYLHPPYNVEASAKFTLKAAAAGLSSVVYKLRYFKNDAVKISLVPHDVTGVIHPGQEKVFT